MNNNSNLKVFWVNVGLSIALLLLTWWITAISIYGNIWTTSLTYFGLAWWSLAKFSKNPKIKPTVIICGLIFGRLAIDIAARIPHFMSTLASLILTITCFSSILLSAICYKEKRTYAYILSAIIVILLNTIVAYVWLNTAPFT